MTNNLLRKVFNPTYLYQICGQLISQILGFFLGIVLVRVSGVEVSGGYYALLAFMNMSVGVINGGIRTNFLRNGDIGVYSTTLFATIISNFLLFIPLSLIAYFVFDFDLSLTTAIFIVSFFMHCMQFFTYSLRVREKDYKILLPSIIPNTILILLLFLIKPITVQSFSHLAVLSWSTVLLFFLADVGFIKTQKVSLKKIIANINASKILMLTILLTQVYGNFDLVLIKKILNAEAAGLYKVAISISMFVLPTIGIFSFIFLSKINKYIELKDFKFVLRKRNQQLKLILAIVSVFVIFSVIFNKYIINFLYKINDSVTIIVSIILSFSVFFNALAMVQNYTLIGLNQEKKMIKVLVVASILNVLLNMILISFWGVIGGAVSNATTQAFILLYTSYIVNKEFKVMII